MKTISDYRAETLIILGDTAGRRYSEAILDTAIRLASSMTDYTALAARPRKITLRHLSPNLRMTLTTNNLISGATALVIQSYKGVEQSEILHCVWQ